MGKRLGTLEAMLDGEFLVTPKQYLKHLFQTAEDYHRAVTVAIAGLLMIANMAGLNTNMFISNFMAAATGASHLYALWVRSPKDDPTAPPPQSESVQD